MRGRGGEESEGAWGRRVRGHGGGGKGGGVR